MNYELTKVVFATNNKNKLAEIREMLAGSGIEVLSLADIGCHADIPETSPTIEGNAIQKAQYVFDNYHISCFADDTGLEVTALGGAPGVYSARYAGGFRDLGESGWNPAYVRIAGRREEYRSGQAGHACQLG